ncbi:MAG: hypothetical protein K2X98_06265 [Alphaproteobacteria bacterium]|nr:hypothetical protein [Alphaproteobacteria bacterium]
MKDYQNDYEPSYTVHLSQRATAMVRSMAIFCLTVLLITGAGLFFAFYTERFSIISGDQGIYVFDRKDIHLNHCNSDGECNAVNLIKSPAELASIQALVGPSTGNMGAGNNLLNPLNQQQCNQQQGQQNVRGSGTQASILGQGIPKTLPTANIQNQMNAAQQQVNAQMNTGQNVMQQQPQLQAPVMPQAIQQPMPQSLPPVVQPQMQQFQPPQQNSFVAPQQPQAFAPQQDFTQPQGNFNDDTGDTGDDNVDNGDNAGDAEDDSTPIDPNALDDGTGVLGDIGQQ